MEDNQIAKEDTTDQQTNTSVLVLPYDDSWYNDLPFSNVREEIEDNQIAKEVLEEK
jgi:hypothetical protein